MSDWQAKYLLVGFSVAAWWGARSIRECDPQGEILAVSEEEGPYSRPLITYVLGRRAPEATYWGEVLQTQGVSVLWGVKAIKLSARERFVLLEDGEGISFEKALLATGGMPVIPPIKGIDLEGVFTLTKRHDVSALEHFLSRISGKRVLVVGGGFIGLKTCEALLDLGLQVTVVELTSRLLQAMLDDDGSKYLEDALERAGVLIITGDTVVAFVGKDGRVARAELASGKHVEIDAAIIAVGVRPRIDWLQNSGLALGRGVLVNEYQETSCEGIFAAGDMAETRHLITGERTVVAIWPEAVRQGKIAGRNMVGQRIPYPGSLPMNVIEVGDTALVSCGLVHPPDSAFEVLVRKEKTLYRKFVLSDGRLVGCILVGDIERAGIFIHLIRKQIPVAPFKERLLDERFGLIALPYEYRKHMVLGAGVEV